MGGSSKGSSPPPVPNQYVDPVNGRTFTDGFGGGPTGAEQLNAEIADRQATEKVASDKTTADADAQKIKDRSDFETRKAGAIGSARDSINSQFREQGLDPSLYADTIAGRINSATGNIADMSPTPQGAFAPSMGQDIINNLTAGRQTQNLRDYNAVFDPNYSHTAISDSWVNPAVDSVLKTQFDPLQKQLDNAGKRGQLSASGLVGANNEFNTQQLTGRASVNKIAQSVLGSNRGQLDDYLGQGRLAAGKAPLSTNFSVDPYKAGAADYVTRDQANFGGDVLNGVGSAKYGDLSALLNAGGAYQGAYDPAATANGAAGPLGGGIDPAAIAAAANGKDPRGLGTQGAF